MNTDDKVFMSLDDIIKQNKSPKSKGPGSVYSVKSTASRRSRRGQNGQRGRGQAGGRGGYQVIQGWSQRSPGIQQRGRGFQTLRYRSQMPNLRFGINSSLGNRFRQRYGIDQRALFPSSYKSMVYSRNLNQQYMQNRVRNAAQFLRERQSRNRQFYQQNYRGQGGRGYRRGNSNIQQGGYRSQYSFNTTARHNHLEQFRAFQQKKIRAQRAARFSPADVDNMTVSVLNDLAFRPRGQAGNRRRRETQLVSLTTATSLKDLENILAASTNRNKISLLDYYNKSEGLGYLLNTWNIRRDSLSVEAVRPTTETSRPPVSSGAGAEVPPSRI
uniref:Uncharacterized protein n=1 Tax=Timema cristinae TaxID=61476 RepID=A0A7R9CHG9_TIMCR|nr:unnamed protein product [Timema cristinae]